MKRTILLMLLGVGLMQCYYLYVENVRTKNLEYMGGNNAMNYTSNVAYTIVRPK